MPRDSGKRPSARASSSKAQTSISGKVTRSSPTRTPAKSKSSAGKTPLKLTKSAITTTSTSKTTRPSPRRRTKKAGTPIPEPDESEEDEQLELNEKKVAESEQEDEIEDADDFRPSPRRPKRVVTLEEDDDKLEQQESGGNFWTSVPTIIKDNRMQSKSRSKRPLTPEMEEEQEVEDEEEEEVEEERNGDPDSSAGLPATQEIFAKAMKEMRQKYDVKKLAASRKKKRLGAFEAMIVRANEELEAIEGSDGGSVWLEGKTQELLHMLDEVATANVHDENPFLKLMQATQDAAEVFKYHAQSYAQQATPGDIRAEENRSNQMLNRRRTELARGPESIREFAEKHRDRIVAESKQATDAGKLIKQARKLLAVS